VNSGFDPKLLHPRHWPAWIGIGLLRALILLPHPWLMGLGRALGGLARRLFPRRVEIALRNLELCFPELDRAQREQLVKAHFASLGMAAFEIPLAWWGSDRRLEGLAEISGLENLRAAADEGRGVLLLSAHFSCLDIGGRFLMPHFPFDAMYRPSNSPVVEHVMSRSRARHCEEIIQRDAIKKLLRRLRAGRAIWYAPDQNTQRKKAVFVKFFGHLASTTPATHKLARMTGARVVPFQTVRKADGSGYRLTLEPALEDFPTEDVEADTERVNRVIERWVREDPEQYLWIHRRFRTRPNAGDPKIYR
jgi:KDO2-lipid IV(A) lauroyltransferase